MPTFKRKPTTCEAHQWDGDFGAAVAFLSPQNAAVVPPDDLVFGVVKSQSTARIALGDWIVREIDGSGFYPVAGDVFAATYEPWQSDPCHESDNPKECRAARNE